MEKNSCDVLLRAVCLLIERNEGCNVKVRKRRVTSVKLRYFLRGQNTDEKCVKSRFFVSIVMASSAVYYLKYNVRTRVHVANSCKLRGSVNFHV